MGLLERFRSWSRGEDYIEEYDEDIIETSRVRSRSFAEERDDPPQPARPSYAGARNDKVVNIHTTTQLQVVLVKPKQYEDNVLEIADHLMEKRAVVLNLESASKDVARRLIDFLAGVTYANKGKIEKVANSTYIITPYNVDIMGDLIDELESNGLYF